jgi:hypothetical protein
MILGDMLGAVAERPVARLSDRELHTVLKTARAGLLGSESKAPDHAAGLILLTDLLTTAMDNPGRGWTSRQSATPREQVQLTATD